MGLFAAAAERPRATVQLIHRVEVPGHGSVQDRRSGWSGATVGHPEEPFVDELRQDVARPQILLPREYPAKGAGRTALLPVSDETIGNLESALIKHLPL